MKEEYQITFFNLLVFELKSLLGRTFLNKKPKLNKEKNYLNLGCGNKTSPQFINADFFNNFKFWRKNIIALEWQLDLRHPLNCANKVFDGIYSEHVLEHLYPSEVERLLSELFRVMKDGAVLRIVVPDIEKYVKFYIQDFNSIDSFEFNKRYKTGCSAIRNMTQNYFHFSVWDFNELKEYLSAVGFSNIQRMSHGNSQDKKLQIDSEERKWESLYVEAVKAPCK